MTDNHYFYNEILLDHSNHPTHYGVVKKPTIDDTVSNESCGDKFRITLKIRNQEKVLEAKWTGTGCAISRATADLMCEAIEGKNPEECADLFAQCYSLMLGEEMYNPQTLGDLQALAEVSRMPARIRCATLPWGVLFTPDE